MDKDTKFALGAAVAVVGILFFALEYVPLELQLLRHETVSWVVDPTLGAGISGLVSGIFAAALGIPDPSKRTTLVTGFETVTPQQWHVWVTRAYLLIYLVVGLVAAAILFAPGIVGIAAAAVPDAIKALGAIFFGAVIAGGRAWVLTS